ncbi:MAG: hypothetical protein IKG92_01470, partial [Bacteroidales bacterium]|nr:hypothetical protein [Bacteroidales bacterium]
EDGVPFSRVLLAVRADADHTGCIYLGVFDDNSDKPLVVYGGPVDAGFTWKLLSDGSLVLSDPTSGESLLMTRADGENYGDTITDVSGTSMIYTADGLTMNNVSYSGTLTKADVDEQTDIMGKVAGEVGQLSEATASDYGKVVCDKGHLHPAKTAVPDGCTAVGILGKVTETGCGLILALKDATSQTWNTINGWTSVTTYADTELKVLPDDAARGANLTSYAALGTTAVSDWAVAQKSDYEEIFTNLGSTKYDDGYTYDANVNAYITTGVGGTALSGHYWSATKNNIVDLAYCFGSDIGWGLYPMSESLSVRPVLGFGPAKLLSAATTSDVGKVVCADGHLRDAKTAVPAGGTAVGILGKVTETGHGLILALQDAPAQTWYTINGWTSTTDFAGTTLKVLPDDAARGSLTSYTTLGTTAVSDWAVAQKSDYEAIFTNLGSTNSDSNGTTYDDNVNAYITTGVGGTALSSNYRYWSATVLNNEYAWDFHSYYSWYSGYKTSSHSVRPVLGF